VKFRAKAPGETEESRRLRWCSPARQQLAGQQFPPAIWPLPTGTGRPLTIVVLVRNPDRPSTSAGCRSDNGAREEGIAEALRLAAPVEIARPCRRQFSRSSATSPDSRRAPGTKLSRPNDGAFPTWVRTLIRSATRLIKRAPGARPQLELQSRLPGRTDIAGFHNAHRRPTPRNQERDLLYTVLPRPGELHPAALFRPSWWAVRADRRTGPGLARHLFPHRHRCAPNDGSWQERQGLGLSRPVERCAGGSNCQRHHLRQRVRAKSQP